MSDDDDDEVAEDMKNKASSIAACWTEFTEPLPVNALIKSVTISLIRKSELACPCRKPLVLSSTASYRSNAFTFVLSFPAVGAYGARGPSDESMLFISEK
jgi:hypothetical protein